MGVSDIAALKCADLVVKLRRVVWTPIGMCALVLAEWDELIIADMKVCPTILGVTRSRTRTNKYNLCDIARDPTRVGCRIHFKRWTSRLRTCVETNDKLVG